MRADGGSELLPSKIDRIKVEAGDLLIADTWGGGGCGDPYEREIDKVAFDVQAGLVTAEGARRYGVVIRDDLTADLAASEKLRAAARGPHGGQVVRSRLRFDRGAQGSLQSRNRARRPAAAAVHDAQETEEGG